MGKRRGGANGLALAVHRTLLMLPQNVVTQLSSAFVLIHDRMDLTACRFPAVAIKGSGLSLSAGARDAAARAGSLNSGQSRASQIQD